MNIYHLKYFTDAAKLGSVSRSAELNFVSHSAVSQGIKSLEEYFEVSLIYHSKRRFQLTPQGEQLLAEGVKLLSSLEDTKESLQSSRQEARGDLVLWAPQSLIVDSLYRTLSLYQKKYPKVRIRLNTGAASKVRAAISAAEGHLGILIDDGHIEQYSSVTIRSGHFVLVAKPKFDDLKDAPLLITDREKVEVVHLAKIFKTKFKKDLNIKMEVLSWGVIKNLVDKNFGVGYVPDYCVADELQAGRLQKLNMPGAAYQYEVKAVWSAEKHLHPNAEIFVELLKQQCQKIKT